MTINELSLEHFRNYERERVSFASGVNVIAGDNAQGKTNILEAVFFFGSGKSCRGARDRDVIRFGEEEAGLSAALHSGSRAQTMAVRFSRTGRRAWQVNGVKLRSPRELLGRLPCVFFGPEELDLIRAGAAVRRRFMDMALCQLRPRYLTELSEYTRLHAHKTRLLRDCRPDSALADVLPDFNRRLAQTGAALISYRADFLGRVAAAASRLHGDISGGRETLGLRYVTQADPDSRRSEEELAGILYGQLETQASAEWAARRCLVGPHRDDIELRIGGHPARAYGSQGQARTAALSLKLSERDVFTAEFGEAPVLLLDDVLSELDGRRQEFILERLAGGQAIITCCEPGRMTRLPDGKNILVEKGHITQL